MRNESVETREAKPNFLRSQFLACDSVLDAAMKGESAPCRAVFSPNNAGFSPMGECQNHVSTEDGRVRYLFSYAPR